MLSLICEFGGCPNGCSCRRNTAASAETGNARIKSPGSIWGHASTWGLLLLLLYFALDGVSPFVNEPTATRAVATSSAGGVLIDRLSKLLMFVACMALPFSGTRPFAG